MKRLRRDAKLLTLFALLAALPLAIWACGDGGENTGGPSGPSSTYNPKIDYPGATISADAHAPADGTINPGDTFGIAATFKDANGRPVEGVPLQIWAENGGGSAPYFSYQTNPTLTDGNGMASIRVNVSATCPNDSYTFVIATYPGGPVYGPQARGYVHIKVGGVGAAVITSLILTTSTPSVEVNQQASFSILAGATSACAVQLQYRAVGAGLNTDWLPDPPVQDVIYPFPLTPTQAGTLSVFARASCQGSGVWMITPTPTTVTVTAPATP